MQTGDLLQPLPPAGPDEALDTLLARGGVRIERIVSFGQSSPDGFWYDQAEDEFVVLLSGSAILRFDDGREVALVPGVWVDLPAHCRHRVEATADGVPTVWLAVFWPSQTAAAASDAGPERSLASSIRPAGGGAA
ncbi:cupin domain-containing protein [Rhodopseudomonas palustris]|uniref:Cupin domain-containing protein n=1 Tax=Rhodopseudomonas palustris TaxID=1076 RepID=A0A418UZ71_RHOPL|nr:cupin domain-containing protein [Rhodopseudomonas palustris]RJF68714.1 cupin domain-containing protein [Rhodopseudomonas palustris]